MTRFVICCSTTSSGYLTTASDKNVFWCFFFICTADFRALRNGERPGFSTFFAAKWKTTWLQLNAEASSSPQVAGSPSRAHSNGAPCAIQLQRMLEDRTTWRAPIGDTMVSLCHFLGVFREEHSMDFYGFDAANQMGRYGKIIYGGFQGVVWGTTCIKKKSHMARHPKNADVLLVDVGWWWVWMSDVISCQSCPCGAGRLLSPLSLTFAKNMQNNVQWTLYEDSRLEDMLK